MEGNERLTDEQLAEIRKRAEAATRGPWRAIYGFDGEASVYSGPTEIAEHFYDNDAKFVEHARQDVPKLLAEIERLRTDQERLISELKKADQISEELERKYMAAKWPEVMADINEYVARKRRDRDD